MVSAVNTVIAGLPPCSASIQSKKCTRGSVWSCASGCVPRYSTRLNDVSSGIRPSIPPLIRTSSGTACSSDASSEMSRRGRSSGSVQQSEKDTPPRTSAPATEEAASASASICAGVPVMCLSQNSSSSQLSGWLASRRISSSVLADSFQWICRMSSPARYSRSWNISLRSSPRLATVPSSA